MDRRGISGLGGKGLAGLVLSLISIWSPGYVQSGENIRSLPRDQLSAVLRHDALGKDAPYGYAISKGRAERNDRHLLEHLSVREDVKAFFRDIDAARKRIKNRLDKLDNPPYEIPKGTNKYSKLMLTYDGTKGVYDLSVRELLRVHLLLGALERREFRKRIVDEMQEDYEDPKAKQGYLKTEHGGFVKMENWNLVLFPVESLHASLKSLDHDLLRDQGVHSMEEANESYLMSFGTREKERYIFEYHFHALKDNDSRRAGPSLFNGGDILSLFQVALQYGASYQFVVKRLSKDKFNVGYFSGEMINKDEVWAKVIPLGNWKKK